MRLLDRGIRFNVNQPYFFAPHFSLGGRVNPDDKICPPGPT